MDGGETTGGGRSDDRGSRRRKRKRRGGRSWLPSSLRKLKGFLLCLSSPRVDDGDSRRHRSAGRGSSSSPPSCFTWLQKGQRRQVSEEKGGDRKDAAQVKGSVDDDEHATEAAAADAAAVAAERRSMAVEMISTVVVESVNPSFLQKLFSKDYRTNGDHRGFKAPKGGTFRPKDNCSSVGPISTSTDNTCLKPNPLVNESEQNRQKAGNPMDSENQTPQLVSPSPNLRQTKPTAAAPFGSTTNVRSSEQESRPASTTTNNSLSGLLVVMTMLWMLLLGGRVVAVIFTCFLFYLLPVIMPPTPHKGESLDDKKPIIEVDYDSKEYKKKVLMEGLLERNSRRPRPTVRFT